MSGIKGLFNKKKTKTAEKAAKEAAREQDDGEWLASAPKKAAPVRVVTSGKVVEDYCPEIVEEVVVDARTQMEIEETKRMLLEVKRRQQEAEAAPAEEPKPARSTLSGMGIDGVDWKAKAEERRLKEMEKNKEMDFPTLSGECSKPPPAAIQQQPQKKNETVFASVNAAEQSASAEEEGAAQEPVAERTAEAAPAAPVAAAGDAAVAETAVAIASVAVSDTPAVEDQSAAGAKKPKKKKGSYMDF